MFWVMALHHISLRTCTFFPLWNQKASRWNIFSLHCTVQLWHLPLSTLPWPSCDNLDTNFGLRDCSNSWLSWHWVLDDNGRRGCDGWILDVMVDVWWWNEWLVGSSWLTYCSPFVHAATCTIYSTVQVAVCTRGLLILWLCSHAFIMWMKCLISLSLTAPVIVEESAVIAQGQCLISSVPTGTN